MSGDLVSRKLLLHLRDILGQSIIRVPVCVLVDNLIVVDLVRQVFAAIGFFQELFCKEYGETDENRWLVLELGEEPANAHTLLELRLWVLLLQIANKHLDAGFNDAQFVLKKLSHLEVQIAVEEGPILLVEVVLLSRL